MNPRRVAIFLALAVILGVPFAMRPSRPRDDRHARRKLVILTPHVPQIRSEFAAAFDEWHTREFKEHVEIDWRTPGGTSEIVKQLEAVFSAAAKDGRFDISNPANPTAKPDTIPFDLFFGGGSYDHTRVKQGVKVTVPGAGEVTLPMSEPAGFSEKELKDWYGESNEIGSGPLYEPEQYWLGTALSSFGIVYNNDVLARLNVPVPATFEDLASPAYFGLIALADPRQSGSVTTSIESMLNFYGWEKGWAILRGVTGNTRYFTNSAPKPPIDVAQGEAAAGLAIDFYGRGQAQAILAPGEPPEHARVGYVDPKGSVYIDADPVTILRGCREPELARRFVRFCLTEEAQALWQFPALARSESKDNPPGSSGKPMGPRVNELRRLPVRRVMYEKYATHMIDKVDPFTLASNVKAKGWRPAIGIMMAAFAIDIADDQRAAWGVLNRARAMPSFPADRLAEMERLYFAFPDQLMPDGTTLPFTEANFKAIAGGWKDRAFQANSAVRFTTLFRENYRRVVSLEREGSVQPVLAEHR